MEALRPSSFLLLAALTLHPAAIRGCCSSPDLPAQLSHRRLLQDANLAAIPTTTLPVDAATVHVPPTGAGSFPASVHGRGQHGDDPSKPPPWSPGPATSEPPGAPAKAASSHGGGSVRWLYIVILPVIAAMLLIGVACALLPCRESTVATIGPWRTGLSGQLQKAFVAGVPKLQLSELQCACEDFSNIVASYPHYTVYKGTLSSGVEIAVVSTMVASSKEWSKHSESCFRKKIDSLSRINHKNFINLLGYCEEEEPFMRMMVLEYAPNGTLYENLHAEGFDHVDWRGRMRIIMGIAYCIQYMHELDPPLVHPNLHSSSILISEDGAAKIADMSVWQEVICEDKTPRTDKLDDHGEPISSCLAANVHNFGLVLLEIISGKLPYSTQEGSLVNLALECIDDDRSIASLLDPSLTAHGENELETICQVIRDCIQSDPRKRPSMREITGRLREAIAISPDAATPRLSPLWWAELEVLSSAGAS